jgi:flagellar protein FliT
MQSNTIIQEYTTLAALMSNMLNAAKQDDWDSVSKIEVDYLHQMQQIKQQEHDVVMGKIEKSQKLSLIKRILADDASIRLLIHPKMQLLSQLMQPGASRAMQTKLSSTYRM